MVVREPYTPRGEPYGLRVVVVKADELLRVRSKSRQMRMYLDGPDNMVAVDLGDVIEFTQSPEPLCLLGISARRKWDA
jgi:NAD+ kinase